MRYLLLIVCTLINIPVFAQTESGKPESVKHTDKTTFRYVEQMPEPGYDVIQYISTNLIYPKKARRKNIEGKVIVQFIVNTDGTIDSVHAINQKVLGYGLEEAAVDLIRNMPSWKKPGRQNGRTVKVFFSQPIMFKLTD